MVWNSSILFLFWSTFGNCQHMCFDCSHFKNVVVEIQVPKIILDAFSFILFYPAD